jgi:hypothetical protein
MSAASSRSRALGRLAKWRRTRRRVVGGAAQQRVDGVAERALEVIAREPAVELHVPDHRLVRRAPQLALDRGGDPAPPSGDEHRGGATHPMAAIAAVDVAARLRDPGEAFDLGERRRQGLAVVRVAGVGCMPTTRPSRYRVLAPNSYFLCALGDRLGLHRGVGADRSRLCSLTALVRRVAAMVACNRTSMLSGPIRRRQRTSELGSMGISSCR